MGKCIDSCYIPLLLPFYHISGARGGCFTPRIGPVSLLLPLGAQPCIPAVESGRNAILKSRLIV
jgi:hypothetical protein